MFVVLVRVLFVSVSRILLLIRLRRRVGFRKVLMLRVRLRLRRMVLVLRVFLS